jgi:hypothetical protein
MKNKLLLLFTVLLLSTSGLFAQGNGELKSLFKTDFNFSGLGVSYELPISKKWSVDLSAGIGASANVNSSYAVRWDVNKSPSTYFKSEFKYNYNIQKRFKKGKNTANNSSNYIAFQTKYITPKLSEDLSIYSFSAHNVLASEVHWGLQRSLGGNWLFNFHAGLGVAKDFDLGRQKSLTNLYLALGLKFSYKIF